MRACRPILRPSGGRGFLCGLPGRCGRGRRTCRRCKTPRVSTGSRRMGNEVGKEKRNRKGMERYSLPNILIPVFVQRQGATGVLHKQLQDADFVILDLWHLLHHLISDEITASALGRQGELLLRPRHGCGLWCRLCRWWGRCCPRK